MMTIGWPLTFYDTVKFASLYIYMKKKKKKKNVEKSFSQNVLTIQD